MDTRNQEFQPIDTVILGGGIAGLFTLSMLLEKGYSAVLLEKSALGSGQTIKSQGIIHGGTKYSLLGKQTEAQRQIAQMPTYWRKALSGGDESIPDLSATEILAEKQLMWALPTLSSKVTGFFAGKLMRSHVDKLEQNQRPICLQDPQCQGSFYALDEPVLNVQSLIAAFVKKYGDYILTDCQTVIDGHHVTAKTQNNRYRFHAEKIIFTAGEGNQTHLDKAMGKQQLRPLRMVYAKVPKDFGQLFIHILEASDKPRLTVSTYPSSADDSWIWYLGGNIAEKGADLAHEQTIELAKDELSAIFPWLDFSHVVFDSFLVNRAEGLEKSQKLGSRPDTPTVFCQNEKIIAYPTKLALSPILAESVLEKMHSAPKHPIKYRHSEQSDKPQYFPGSIPRIADFPWG